MKRLTLAFVLLGWIPLTIACSGANPDGAGSNGADSNPANSDPDLALLQGNWETIRMATDGADLPPERMAKNTTVTFEGNKMITKRKGKVVASWPITLDSSTNPKRMTINTADPGDKERLSLLIYKIEGDTLTTLSGSRSYPTEFTTNTVKGCYLTVRRKIED